MIGPFKYLFSLAQEAVMVFFMLSGFVVSWSVQSSRSPWCFRRYFFKRFIRIYSVWFFAMVFLWILCFASGDSKVSVDYLDFIFNLLMLQDFTYGKPAVLAEPLLGNTPLWSLHYEWWFYMLFPVLLLTPKYQQRVHIVGIVSLLAACLYAYSPNFIYRLLFYFSIWWIGVYAAEQLKANGILTLKDLTYPLVYTSLSSVPLLFLCWQHFDSGEKLLLGVHPILEARHLLSAVILVVVAFFWRKLSWFGFDYSIRFFSILAPISYSLYITHYLSIHKAEYLSFLPGHFSLPLYIIVTLFFCFLIECVLYPLLRNKFLNARMI